MASIKSVLIEFDQEQQDQRRRVLYSIVLTDDLGEDHEFRIGPKILPKDSVPQDDAIATAQSLLAQQPEDEASAAEAAIESGDALTRITSARWGSAKDTAKRLLRAVMREEDPGRAAVLITLLEPLYNYLTTNYTGAQLINWLGITPAQGVKLKNRFEYVLTQTGTVKGMLLLLNEVRDEFE